MVEVGVEAAVAAGVDVAVAGAGAAAGSAVETGAEVGVVATDVAAAAPCVLREAYWSRAPSDLGRSKVDADGPGAGSGWLSTGETGADSGAPLESVSSVSAAAGGAGAASLAASRGVADSEIGYAGLAMAIAGPGGWSSLIG